MKYQLRWLATTLAIAVITLFVGATLISVAPNPVAAAPAAQEAVPRTITLYGPTTVSGTAYSSAPLTVQGNDLARITNYDDVDIFVANDVSTAGTVTVTVQVSPDESAWANLTDVVQTFNSSGTLASNTYTYRVVVTGASATGMLRAPLAGEFLRVRIDSTAYVTPTIKATLR